LCALITTADPSPMVNKVSLALVCGWSSCLALVWCAAVALAWRWRLTREGPAGWLAAAAVCGAVYLTSCTARLYAGYSGSDPGVTVIEGVDVVMIAVWLLLVHRGIARPHEVPRVGPIGLGLLIGAAGAGLQAMVLAAPGANPLAVNDSSDRLLIACLGAGGIAVLFHARGMSQTMRRQLLAICGLGTLSRLAAPAEPIRPGIGTFVSLLCGLIAAAMLTRTGVALLIQARSQAEAMAELAVVATGFASCGEQLHELRASFAGLASAIRVLTTQGGELPRNRRTDLTAMLGAEVDRLERLLNGRPSEAVPDVDVDGVIRSIVIARQLAGQQVEWERTGCHVQGSPDLIATAVNMLLVNAAVHAPGARVRVSATTEGGSVRIRVSDNGPGIPPSVRRRIFVKGVRGKESPGHGIGLNFAGRLAAVQGGSLQLADGHTGATTFELTLPCTPA